MARGQQEDNQEEDKRTTKRVQECGQGFICLASKQQQDRTLEDELRGGHRRTPGHQEDTRTLLDVALWRIVTFIAFTRSGVARSSAALLLLLVSFLFFSACLAFPAFCLCLVCCSLIILASQLAVSLPQV